MLKALVVFLPVLALGWVQTSSTPLAGSEADRAEIFVDLLSKGVSTLAVRDFSAVDARKSAQAKEIADVMRADLTFASVYRVVSGRAEIEIQGELTGSGNSLVCRIRIYDTGSSKMIFGTEYTTTSSPRRLAHRIADDIVGMSGYQGVAETYIAFASDRGGNKAIYQMDYDGFDQKPVSRGHFLDLSPRWSPDGRSLTFVSYPKRTGAPTLTLVGSEGSKLLFEGTSMVAGGAFSPDGERIAFSSSHEGNPEIYVMNRDGSGLKRLTDHPMSDVTPTWSPTGKEIAFTSERSGSPQIYVMDTEGLNLRRLPLPGRYNAEPAWSPSTNETFAEIAYASRIEGARFDVVVYNFTTGQARQLTAGKGLNESPSWAPNGRHLVFTSTRTGTHQLFAIQRDGSQMKQITFEGENTTPAWGPFRR